MITPKVRKTFIGNTMIVCKSTVIKNKVTDIEIKIIDISKRK